MSRLWDKGASGSETDPLVLDFTTGRDPELDLYLVPYDCVASAAHAQELQRIGVLTAKEAANLRRELGRIRENCLAGDFSIPYEMEDGHTAIEAELTAKLGKAGAKIHAGRSRNDQVSAAMKLYLIDKLCGLEWSALHLAEQLLSRSKTSRKWPMPGFTHIRRAMPSTVGMWFAGYAERLLDDTEDLKHALVAADKSPMGTAAGYGSPLPLSRPRLARKAGFTEVTVVPAAAQLSRGRTELSALCSFLGLSLTLDRLGADVVLFTTAEFGLLRLPDELTTGSSIMPQKRNPDLAECLRPVSSMLAGRVVEVSSVMSHLPSGYHRDLAATKGPVIDSVRRLDHALSAATLLVQKLEVDRDNCAAAVTPEIMQAHKAAELAAKGMPFRDAYRKVADGKADAGPVDIALEEPGLSELKALRERLSTLRRSWRRVRSRIDRTTKAAFEVQK